MTPAHSTTPRATPTTRLRSKCVLQQNATYTNPGRPFWYEQLHDPIHPFLESAHLPTIRRTCQWAPAARYQWSSCVSYTSPKRVCSWMENSKLMGPLPQKARFQKPPYPRACSKVGTLLFVAVSRHRRIFLGPVGPLSKTASPKFDREQNPIS